MLNDDGFVASPIEDAQHDLIRGWSERVQPDLRGFKIIVDHRDDQRPRPRRRRGSSQSSSAIIHGTARGSAHEPTPDLSMITSE
jgi:hypothetical protein